MCNIYDIAKYIILAYENQTGSRYDNSELKLQKLMYLTQRESLALTGDPMFDESFEGWRHGPVLTELRHFFDENYEPIDDSSMLDLTDTEKYVINNVISQYGMYEAWYLANLTHSDKSWQNSRVGLNEDDQGNRLISVEDIREDAKNVRIYDHIFDMYVDEFEDYNI